MIDFNKAREVAFSVLSEVETIVLLSNQEKTALNFQVQQEGWKIITEITGRDGVGIEITLHLSFPVDFPLTPPSIYLSQKDYDILKYLPHVDSNKLICTYDTESTRPDINNPAGVVFECIKKAKNILEQGISGLNHGDFEEEFLAYWNCKYSPNDKHRDDVVCLINPSQKPKLPTLLDINTTWGVFNYAVHDNDELAENFKEFLKMNNMKFTEVPCFYCGLVEIDFTPPFEYSNDRINQLFEGLSEEKKNEFKNFINAKTFPKFVLASVNSNNKNIFIGWFYKPFNLTQPGFRPGFLTAFSVMTTFQKTEKIVRVTPEIITEQRFSVRSAGTMAEKKFIFTVAGLGSVGSHLVQMLNSMNFPEFRLVDEDKLRTENIARHLLGFSYLSQFKTLALKDMLMLKNPTQSVKTKEISIVNAILNESAFINDCDFIFLATGKSNIENWIGYAIDGRLIKKPVFFIWVEPFLAGGHCLFIVPGSNPYHSYFSPELTFKNNVISSGYYSNPSNILTMKEAGCQTSYVPYSGSNLINFLSALIPNIMKIIETNATTSKAITWIGNIGYLNELGIPLSAFAKHEKSGNIIQA